MAQQDVLCVAADGRRARKAATLGATVRVVKTIADADALRGMSPDRIQVCVRGWGASPVLQYLFEDVLGPMQVDGARLEILQ